ncbi:MAG: 50S ribosomal protein L13 [Candidatus Magasanikbacteria bacterium GW2011_GWA2_56_11]|uniref:Large ribosomal subunit protein uL13 n=1 Tax=Candidatus Magasanikbacteria bacterium GW2011_GWA2_56_11 TaxID=1619044 RepID=A0A0G2B890_9BACT|nr:MAG: 50S ribosomal protein L13 [Candidatus Magasanikbacteria bacterium GW2011_GWA2_56_11]
MKKTPTIKNAPAVEIDAAGRAVGRVAAEVAMILQGKHKATFVKHLICGDAVKVKNAGQVKFTGRKLEQKDYLKHSMYPGGLKRRAMKHVFADDPAAVVRRAVYGMLPKNKLRDEIMKRLTVEA